jgi:putative flippase GtrA
MAESKTYQKKELLRFLVSGFTAVAIDLGVYFLLVMIMSTNLAKGISFISGTFVAFMLNKYWTFEVKERSYLEIVKFITLYAITLAINIAVNKIVLNMALKMDLDFGFRVIPKAYMIAFLCATGTSTILNFIGQKFWVFKQR